MARALRGLTLGLCGRATRASVFEQMDDVVVVLDRRQRVVDMNAAALRLFRVALRPTLGRLFDTLYPGWRTVLDNASGGERYVESRLSIDGQQRVFDARVTVLRNARGQRRGYVVGLRDTTRRLQVEHELRAQKELFESLVAVTRATAEQVTLAATLQNVLRVTLKLTGAVDGSFFMFTERGTLVQSIFATEDATRPGSPELADWVLAQGLAGWVMRTREIALVEDTQADPRWLHLPNQPYVARSALAVPVLAEGQVLGLLTLVHNLPRHFRGEHVQLMNATADHISLAIRNTQLYEIQRRLADEAQAASRAKSAFLATMSHELRTPLNTVIGYSQLLSAELGVRGAEDLAGDLGLVTAAGNQLLCQVDDILRLAQLEVGGLELQVAPVDLTLFLTNLVAVVDPLVARGGNKLVFDCPADIGVVETDQIKLHQVLMSLLSNACKFTQAGRITLRVRRAPAGGAVEFAVEDTGIGMTPEQVGQLFLPFVQADGSSTRRHGGTGLGLAISWRLCQLMRGTLTVRSLPGEGTTFTFGIPTCYVSLPLER